MMSLQSRSRPRRRATIVIALGEYSLSAPLPRELLRAVGRGKGWGEFKSSTFNEPPTPNPSPPLRGGRGTEPPCSPNSSVPQHHQGIERDCALTVWQCNQRIDVNAFDLIAQIVR